MQLIYKSG